MLKFIDMYRQRIAMMIVTFHVVFFAGWYMQEADVFEKPIATIKVQTVAYDPRDLLSGQFIRLNFDFNILSDQDSRNSGTDKEIWAVLEDNNGLYQLQRHSDYRPNQLKDTNVVIKGYLSKFQNNRAIFGIEKYFVPEGTPEPDREATVVELDIYKSGKARIKQVYVDGIAWP